MVTIQVLCYTVVPLIQCTLNSGDLAIEECAYCPNYITHRCVLNYLKQNKGTSLIRTLGPVLNMSRIERRQHIV